jgi:hypothetical protein
MNATLNVMIHGLFFMELSTDDSGVDFLEITAPDIDDHDFMGGVRNNLAVLNNQTIDWTTVISIHGRAPQPPLDPIPADIPPTIMQFSRSTTNTGDLVHSNKGIIKLPWPRNFFSRRLGPIPNFLNSKVGKEITDRCSAGHNTQVGVVTGFAYDFDWSFPILPSWGPTLNFHFYYQPPKGHDIYGVNVDLIKAGKIFGSPRDFDLQLDPNNNPAVTPVGTGGFLTGVGTEDEISLDEKLTLLNPTQIDINKLLECLGEQSKIPPIVPPVKGGANFFLLLASTANCPNMFVGS